MDIQVKYFASLRDRLGRSEDRLAATKMRDFNNNEPVRGMTLEHYSGMTERHLQRIIETTTQE